MMAIHILHMHSTVTTRSYKLSNAPCIILIHLFYAWPKKLR